MALDFHHNSNKQLRGAQITLQELASGNFNIDAMSTQEKKPVQTVPYAEDDSEDEEPDDTIVYDESKIQKILTINPHLVKEGGGTKDSDARKIPLTQQIRNNIKVSRRWLTALNWQSPVSFPAKLIRQIAAQILLEHTVFNVFLILVVIGYHERVFGHLLATNSQRSTRSIAATLINGLSDVKTCLNICVSEVS